MNQTQKNAARNLPIDERDWNSQHGIRGPKADIWAKLATAVANARSQLTGQDLDTFEALIARPSSGNIPVRQVQSGVNRAHTGISGVTWRERAEQRWAFD